MMEENSQEILREKTEEDAVLPEDLMTEIFLRTPMKAVGRFRMLSKSWNSELSSSRFVRLHFMRRINQQNLLIIRPFVDPPLIIDAPIANGTVSREIEFGFDWNVVKGACNALVLLTNIQRDLFLVNPKTLKYVQLPRIYFGPNPSSRCSSILHALGYDSFNDDYKVLVISYDYRRVENIRRYDRIIHVYSAKSGAWQSGDTEIVRRVANHIGACVNGAIHAYIVTDSADEIDAFNLADGVFRQIPAPPNNGRARGPMDKALAVLDGCLCVVNKYMDNGEITIRMMKQYGVADSWTNISIVRTVAPGIQLPLCFIGDSQIVCLTYTRELVVYNLTDRTMEFLIVDGVTARCREGVPFVDSLVSPQPRDEA